MGGRERERERSMLEGKRERGAVGGEWRHLEEKREEQLEGRQLKGHAYPPQLPQPLKDPIMLVNG